MSNSKSNSGEKNGTQRHLAVLFDADRIERKAVKKILQENGMASKPEPEDKLDHIYVQFENGRDVLNKLVNGNSKNVTRIQNSQAIANELGMHENSVLLVVGPVKGMEDQLRYFWAKNSIKIMILPG